jgi:hypothetical protein
MTLKTDKNGIVQHFRKKINTGRKQELKEFLLEHYRYHTGNSWNRSTSYANCVKINHLPLTQEQRNVAYDLLDLEETYDCINESIADWGREQGWRYQAGFNGRSSGYLVMYQGEKKSDGSHICWPFRSIDSDPDCDFNGWQLEDFQSRAKLVQSFDLLCDQILTQFIYLCDNYEVKEETIMIPKTVKVLQEKGMEAHG